MSEIVAGALIHDRYRVTRPIGKGGMGAVYEAVDTRLQNTVAIKQLTLRGAEADRAFEREARLLANLRHPALVVVIDYFLDEGTQVLVMQYIEGEDLASLLERRGNIPVDEIALWAHGVLDALHYLHNHEPPVLHRDIKPSNLKCTPSGEIVLLDFGLAKGGLDAHTTVTEDKSLFGFTLKYAPIEQILGSGTDARSDLYGLGATLYHLATGTQPVSSLERSQAVRNGELDPLVNPRLLNFRLSERFARLLTRAMALEPVDRFESAAAMRAALLADEFLPTIGARSPDVSTTFARRVDAAMPSHPVVGRQTDLIVQVRFPDSPFLGLEDWPTRRRPTQIEQGSEALQLVHAIDPATGERLPTRLRVKVTTPDFAIEGQSELLIEVPPGEYSKRLAFLLTPRHAGYCRINVEVFAPDALYLGTIAVEAETIAEGIAEPILRVASLVLGVFSRQTSVIPAGYDPRADVEMTSPRQPPAGGPSPVDSNVPQRSSLRAHVRSAGRIGRRGMTIGASALIATIGAGVLFMQTRGIDVAVPASSVGPWTTAGAPAAEAPAAKAPAAEPPRILGTGRAAFSESQLSGSWIDLESSNLPGVSLMVAPAQRSSSSRLRLTMYFVNGSTAPASISIDYSRTQLSHGKGVESRVVADAAGTARDGTFSATIPPTGKLAHWIEFEVSSGDTGAATATLVPVEGRPGARFPAFPFLLPDR